MSNNKTDEINDLSRRMVFSGPPERGLLDLHTHTVYLTEPEKSIQTIDATMEGIKLGDKIRPVTVYDLHTRGYFAFEGHNRIVAHYKANAFLPVNIAPLDAASSDMVWSYIIERPIITPDNVNLIDDPHDLEKRSLNNFYREPGGNLDNPLNFFTVS